MIKILLSDLKSAAENRPDGYYQEVISKGRIETADIIILDDNVYRELLKKFSPERAKAKEIQSIPRDQWPLWAKALAQFSKPEDKGIGDVVARMIGAENSAAFKSWHIKTFGKSCGCNGRQRALNLKYQLNQ